MRISGTEFENRVHNYLQMAQEKEPVIIECDGQPCAVVVSYAWYHWVEKERERGRAGNERGNYADRG